MTHTLEAANPRLQPERWHPSMWEKTFGRERRCDLTSKWPKDARIAVLLTFDTQGDVDAAVPGYQGNGCFWKDDKINYVDLCQRQYGTRRGVQRILDILERCGVTGTFPITGITAEWYPEIVDAIASSGHEIAVHGYRHIQLFNLDEAGEREEIEAATAAVENALGKRPVGWRSPMYSTTERTIRILTDLGYLYTSDFHNDDLPYVLENDGRALVQIPANMDDWELNLMNVREPVGMGSAQPYSSPGQVTDILTSYFNMLYQEAEQGPQVMQYCMHPKITGRPHRGWGLEQSIKHMQAHEGVWFTTMEGVARLCL